NFPRFTLPAGFLNIISNQMPAIILSHTAGVQAVGWFGLSSRMLGLPSTIIASSIGDVFRQRATKDYYETGTCRPVFMKVFKTLVALALPAFLILAIIAPSLFE